MQISDKNNLIEKLKIKNNNQLAANDKKVKEQFDLLQTYKQKISKKEKEPLLQNVSKNCFQQFNCCFNPHFRARKCTSVWVYVLCMHAAPCLYSSNFQV